MSDFDACWLSKQLSLKQKNGQAAFVKFVWRMGTQKDWLSVESRPEPDLLVANS